MLLPPPPELRQRVVVLGPPRIKHLDWLDEEPTHTLPIELLTYRIVYLYTIRVIKSYRHKGLKRFAEFGSKAGIQPKHADRLRRLLTALDVASVPRDMDAPGNKLHPLEGDLAHHWAVSVSGNWRLTFSFDKEDVIFVDYQDYH